MTKKKSAAASSLTKILPASQWSKLKAAERITYDEDKKPDGWQTRAPYTGAELSYRGQERRSFVSLAGRPLP